MAATIRRDRRTRTPLGAGVGSLLDVGHGTEVRPHDQRRQHCTDGVRNHCTDQRTRALHLQRKRASPPQRRNWRTRREGSAFSASPGCTGRIALVGCAPPLSLRGGVTFELWACIRAGVMPSGIPLSDRRNFRENRPLLVSAELARPSITQQMGSEFHPARVTTINARLPVSKRGRPACRKYGEGELEVVRSIHILRLPYIRIAIYCGFALDNPRLQGALSRSRFLDRETGHPSAGFTCSSPRSERSHHMSYPDARG